MMPLDQVRARLADGAPVSPWDARRASVHATRPLARTSYGVSAAEFNATLPKVAHEVATARAVQALCSGSTETDAGVLKAAGLVREQVNSEIVGGPISPRRVRTWRSYVMTAAGRRLCARVARYLASGGSAPVRPVADILREVAAQQPPAVNMPTPHPFVVSRYAEPKDVVRHAVAAAEQHEKDLMARLGFHRRNTASRRLNSMDRILLRRDVRDAELLGLVRREWHGEYTAVITTDQGARQAAEIPAPYKAGAA